MVGDRKLTPLARAEEELAALVERLEAVVQRTRGFGFAQEQDALIFQREVKDSKHLLLKTTTEINQNVSTGDQVDLRKRRVLNHVVAGENHHVADVILYSVLPVFLVEVLVQQRAGKVGHRGLGVAGAS